jgi:hypothetical protein
LACGPHDSRRRVPISTAFLPWRRIGIEDAADDSAVSKFVPHPARKV